MVLSQVNDYRSSSTEGRVFEGARFQRLEARLNRIMIVRENRMLVVVCTLVTCQGCFCSVLLCRARRRLA